MLRVENLHAYYGKSHVLHGVNFEVGQGEIVALLGRNGSGRSTTAKAIMGLVECQGRIDWKGQPIQGKKAYEIAHLGIGYVPENRDIFPKLTVHQNLQLGQKKSGQKHGDITFGTPEDHGERPPLAHVVSDHDQDRREAGKRHPGDPFPEEEHNGEKN